MKICAITMVYRDYWALAQWIRHYSKHLGIENLYVVVHGPDEKVNDIASGANIWTIPRESLEAFDKRRNKMLNQFQSGLLQFYDWVIRTDTDELICVDPDLHGSLERFLAQTTDDAVFATGLNVFEQADEQEMPHNVSVFDCREAAVITGNYSKAWAVKTNVPLMRHGVKLTKDKRVAYSYSFPQGVYLAHIKFANIDALADVNATRKEVARSGVSGLPGWGWKRADEHTKKFFIEAETLDFTSWSEAVADALQRLTTDMKYDEKDGVIRAPGIPYLAKIKLPKWFKET
ncbi:glycosyltransferase family 2 protein [Tateyamaria sp. Alg231-49]|uniref:glycosyltransferase family 2 protein n=1 Tax=Tateyamaria sp. Alg231-49 TaxID=1922219 RepID=UPI000D550A13|nr:glycosyltransferase family 2 protein [Tateyamaria sp. Alg231-49]